MGTNTRPSLLLWPALIRLPLDNRSRDYIYSPPWAAVQGLRFILLNGLSKLVPFPVTCYKRKGEGFPPGDSCWQREHPSLI